MLTNSDAAAPEIAITNAISTRLIVFMFPHSYQAWPLQPLFVIGGVIVTVVVPGSYVAEVISTKQPPANWPGAILSGPELGI